MPRIELRGLTKLYNGVPAVEGVSLTVEEGELLSLVGHSGCGKTTILRIISGLTFPDEGTVWLDGEDITRRKPEKRNVVMIFQDSLLFPHLTVAENISFGLKMQGVPRSKRMQKIRELLTLMQLPADIGSRYPSQLSGGQQQRVALARALALEPEVLLLDEPLSNLDPRLRDDLRELILGIHGQLEMTTILVPHDRDEAMMMADRIAVMDRGRILQVDEPAKIYCHPAGREVAGLFGECNFVSGVLKDGIFAADGVCFRVPPGKPEGPVEACIRSEQIAMVEPRSDCPTGVIRKKKYAGGQSIFKVALGNLTLVVRGNDYFAFDLGNQVGLEIDWSQVAFMKSSRHR